MNKKLQIYILCRDRTEFALKSIESVLRSASNETEVIVSDNSEGNDLEEISRNRYPEIRFIRRIPTLSSIEHFKTIIDEANAEYLVMFHDDDVMLPGFIETLLPIMESDESIAAIGCNAEIINNEGIKQRQYFLPKFSDQIKINNIIELIKRYFSLHPNIGYAPFPSYLYRRRLLRSEMINFNHGGKHSDFTFLHKVMLKGALIWHPEVMMLYRVHCQNDSATESLRDRLSLVRYLLSQPEINRQSQEIRHLRFHIYWSWLRNGNAKFISFSKKTNRERIIKKFLFGMLLTEPYLWLSVVKKLGRYFRFT